VIFLSARTAVEDKCHALAVGGDDYVTKSFDLTEVSARIRALIRRARGAVRAAPVASRRLCAAGVELDAGTREVWRHGTAVPLSATEFALLKVLLENAGQVISKGVHRARGLSWTTGKGVRRPLCAGGEPLRRERAGLADPELVGAAVLLAVRRDHARLPAPARAGSRRRSRR